MKKRKGKKFFKELYADHFVLYLAAIFNLVIILLLLGAFCIGYAGKYRYFTFHFTSWASAGEFALYLLRLFLPCLLTVPMALLLNALMHKPQWLQNIISLLCGLALLWSIGNTVKFAFIARIMLPVASYTTNAANFGQYDEYPTKNPPSTGCPNLAFSMPKNAENVEFSYWYIHTLDYEWKINVSYSLPKEEYEALRDEQLAKLDAMENITRTQEGNVVRLDSGDYREGYGGANTIVIFAYCDETCTIWYTLDCFQYEVRL